MVWGFYVDYGIGILRNMGPDYRIAIEWDLATWSRALAFFEKTIKAQKPSLEKGLEIGARNGGLSWFFARKYGSQMCCTDSEIMGEQARMLHEQAGLSSRITYQQADATRLPFPDQTFDFVLFKSVLGAIGRNGRPELQQKALEEIYRVLKPGGILFFAENLRGSVFHRLARRFFVPWGKTWRYVTLRELQDWLGIFERKELHATGFFAAFVPGPECLKTLAAKLDTLLLLLPESGRYVGYGCAIRKQKM